MKVTANGALTSHANDDKSYQSEDSCMSPVGGGAHENLVLRRR